MKTALITGITGQDGSYLAEFLLEKGYEVHGLKRPTSTPGIWRIEHILPHLQLHHGDLGDTASLGKLLDRIQPDEIYNLAAQSHSGVSFEVPEYTAQVTGLGVLRLLDAMRRVCPAARLYQAGSSEMFGRTQESPQRETTPFHPCNPYAVAKAFAHWSVVNYRESRGLFACNGITYSHESPRRPETFVTRKITLAAARIKAGLQKDLKLGDLSGCRDWGYAKEYVEAMWLVLQQDEPDDYIIATGETHSVFEFLDTAFTQARLIWQDHIIRDKDLKRPLELDPMLGDGSKIKQRLGWEPKTKFGDLVKLMVDADIAATETSR